MDGNDALLFRMRMKTLKHLCASAKACVEEEASEFSEDTLDTNLSYPRKAPECIHPSSTKACVKEEASELSEDTLDTNVSYPREAPKFIHPSIREKCNGCFILKTPLWAIQYGLSYSYPSEKKYSIEVSNALELTTADDGAYIICGFLNPNCRVDTTTNQQTGYPHDPSYDMKSMNERCEEIRTVVLYFPSTGNYYSPRFVSDTSRLRAKGLWLRNHHLATKNVLQMLPSTALRIQKSDGMPDSTGQLLNFTNYIYVATIS